MFQLLYKYLILHKKVSIPGIGAFHIQREPAKHDFARDVFVAPAFKIIFTAGISVDNSHICFYISSQQQVTESEAISRFNNFSLKLKEDLDTNNTAHLPGLGQLLKSESGEVHFDPEPQLLEYFPKVGASRMIRQPELHPMTKEMVQPSRQLQAIPPKHLTKHSSQNKKSYWWIYAIVLAVAGIGAIAYYYLLNGSLD